MTKKRSFLSMICCCTDFGSSSQVSSFPYGLLRRKTPPARCDPQQVLPFEKSELVAGDEAGRGDQIGRLDRVWPKSQMRNRLRAGFVGIVDEVALRILFRVFGDDLHAVLVGANRAVGAQTVENRAGGLGRLDREVLFDGEAAERDVVLDAEGEAVSSRELALTVTLGEFIEGGLRPWPA